VFDLEAGELVATIDQGPSYDTVLATSRDGSRLAIGDASGSIRMVRTSDWQVERTLRGLGHNGEVAISADGRWLAVERGSKTAESVWIWNLERLELLGRMQASPTKPGEWTYDLQGVTVVYSSHLQWMGVQGSDAYQLLCKAFKYGGGGAERSWQSVRYATHKSAITADGHWLALLDGDKVVVVDLTTEKVAHEMPFQAIEDGPWEAIVGIAVSPTGRKAAVGLTFAKRDVLVFDFAKRRVTEKRACCDTYDSLAFDPSGRYLAIGDCYQNDISLRPITNTAKRRQLSGHTDSIRSLAFAPNGDLVSSGADGQVILWNGKDFSRRATLVLFEDPFGWAGFTLDGEAWGSDGFQERFAHEELDLAGGKIERSF
jgi:WD40 repeat protein